MTVVEFPIPNGPTLQAAQALINCLNKCNFKVRPNGWRLGQTHRTDQGAFINVIFQDKNDALLAKITCYR